MRGSFVLGCFDLDPVRRFLSVTRPKESTPLNPIIKEVRHLPPVVIGGTNKSSLFADF
jgi:hypothetical protein